MTARRLLVVALVGLAVVVGAARPAAAHATLEATTPPADSVLDSAPAVVELRFSEAVDPALGGVRVFGPDGDRADRGRVERADGDRVVRVPVDAGQQGTYTVAWSVVSEDSHTISGSFVFSVGRETGAVDVAASGRDSVRFAAGAARWAAFAGTLLLVGTLAFQLLVASGDAGEDRRRRLVWLLRAGAALTLVGSAAVLVTQVALASGRGVWSSVGLIGDAVANTRFGALSFARACLALATLALVLPSRLAFGRVGRALLWGAGAGLLVVPGLAGHAWTVEPRWASVSLDAVHLAAASVWIGGLAALLVTAPGTGAAAALTSRFSRVALGAVVVVAMSGSVTGYLQVRSADALTGTGYGQLLIAKVAAVAVLVGLGWVNRRRLIGLLPSRETLFGVVRAELAIAVVVIALTAALVNRPPARNDVAAGPFSAVVATENDPTSGQVQLQVEPARPGANDVHLYFLSAEGLPRPVDAIEMTVGRAGIPPRRVTVTPITADHASAYGVSMPSPGVWTLTITAVRQGLPFTATVEVPIR